MKSPDEVLALHPAHDDTLLGAFESRMAAGRERPFLVFEDRTWTWAGFHDAALGTARALAAQGVRAGDRVSVMSLNSDRFLVLFFAAARLGAVLVPINPAFGVSEAAYVLHHAEPRLVAGTADTLPVATRAAEGLRETPAFVALDAGIDGLPGLDDLVTTAPPADLPDRPGAEATCLIVYTSGTTGFPKGVMHSQRNVVIAGEGFLKKMWLQPDDRVLCVLPLFHVNALCYSLSGAIAAGGRLVLAPRFSASTFWRLAAATGATEVNVIAAIANVLARRPRSEFVPGHRIDRVYGAPLSPAIVELFQKEFHVRDVIEGYGMSEIPGVIGNLVNGPQKVGSMGRALPPAHGRPLADMRLVDDAGRDVPDGQVGELLVRTPIIMQGYYRDPEQTAAAFRDGWFLTGDLVRRDADGFHHFVARKNDIIRRRGENISGAELDRVIGEHPDVVEAAAIAVEAELGEDDILIAVVVRPGAATTPADIAAWCAGRLAPIKVPRYVAFVEDLPHTPTHRVAKFRLKADPSLRARAVDLHERASARAGCARVAPRHGRSEG